MSRTEGAEINVSIPSSLNLALTAAFLCVGVFQLFVLPLLLVRTNVWWASALIPCVLSTTTNWSLIHEAIHGLLSPFRRVNDISGRLLAIFFGAPFELLRFPHLLHHHLNGTVADRPEFYEREKVSHGVATLKFYPVLIFGIYAVEVAGTFICLMPRQLLRRVAQVFPKAGPSDTRVEAYLLQPQRLMQVRIDACLVIGLYSLAFWSYGGWWPLLALSIVGRGIISSIADNSYHYGAPLGAGARSAYNLKLPIGASILHFNLHRVHHVHPTLPWSGLPAAFKADGESYDVGYASAMLRQFRGPIADRDYAVTTNAPRI
ncbi:MAG: fatty acid desaturase [Rhizomicrobium sp.]